MGVEAWMKAAIEDFFKWRPEPTQDQCEKHATSLLKASSVRPVGMQGSLSYTVVATTETIVSYRVAEAKLGGDVEALAHQIHGDLVPKSTYHGTVGGEEDVSKHLLVYTMPYLPGRSCLETLKGGPELDETVLRKHNAFVKDLARYFARCYLRPQAVPEEKLKEQQASMLHKLSLLRDVPRFAYLSHDRGAREPGGEPPPLQPLVPAGAHPRRPVADEHPPGRGDGRDHRANRLVPRARLAPFGTELAALREMSGVMNSEGWSDYTHRARSQAAFWGEFWAVTGIEDPARRSEVRRSAELACKLGLVICYAFCKMLGGAPLDDLSPRPARSLEAWLTPPRWSSLVLRGNVVGEDEGAKTGAGDEGNENKSNVDAEAAI